MRSTEVGRPAGMLPRLLLLVLLMLGVAAMHTLGHVVGHDAPQPSATGMLHAEGAHSPVPDSGSGDAPSGAPDPASVCLAILAALLVLAPLGPRIAGLAAAWLRSHPGRRIPRPLRGPPPLSLILTRTVVLRT
ncbi:hypothetical protein [Nonomuraea basaltis]|uniref:hypothetical protein n=1 Tax=Nonomuraea basaltis TaxID=2495887 RepID=UPI00110C458C|nr:hypothetical protein [Nonomuraea basaltis]TMR95770.1 hypothetical protein EJK15_26950 [Nonomuraea basaltis]